MEQIEQTHRGPPATATGPSPFLVSLQEVGGSEGFGDSVTVESRVRAPCEAGTRTCVNAERGDVPRAFPRWAGQESNLRPWD